MPALAHVRGEELTNLALKDFERFVWQAPR